MWEGQKIVIKKNEGMIIWQVHKITPAVCTTEFQIQERERDFYTTLGEVMLTYESDVFKWCLDVNMLKIYCFILMN